MAKYIIIILSIFLVSCEEYFVPDIDVQENSLVFEGLVTDQPNEHYVKITQSNSYDNDNKYIDVTGYTVYIEEESGFKILLPEEKPGCYKPDTTVTFVPPGFLNKGTIGRKYRMVAESPDGKIYHSDWELLGSSAPIDSLFCEYAEELNLIYESGTGYREQLVPGINILNNFSANGHTSFYRYEFDIIYQALNYYMPLNIQVYTVRPESSMSFDYISTVNANLSDDNKISENEVYFLPLTRFDHIVVVDSLEFDNLGRRIAYVARFTQKGFLIQIKQHSLSQKGFQFWDAVYELGAASGEVFDPVETQIEGNISNVNDSTELVFGYFGASAVTKKAMYMNIFDERVLIKPAKYFPILTKPMASSNAFDFWVTEFEEL